MEDSGFGRYRIGNKPEVVPRHPQHLLDEAHVWPLIPSQIEEPYAGLVSEFGAVELSAPDHIEIYSLGRERSSQAESIRSVAASSKKRHSALAGHFRVPQMRTSS